MILNTLSRLKIESINAHQVYAILVASVWTASDLQFWTTYLLTLVQTWRCSLDESCIELYRSILFTFATISTWKFCSVFGSASDGEFKITGAALTYTMTMGNSAMKNLSLIDQLKTTDEMHLWITQQPQKCSPTDIITNFTNRKKYILLNHNIFTWTVRYYDYLQDVEDVHRFVLHQ